MGGAAAERTRHGSPQTENDGFGIAGAAVRDRLAHRRAGPDAAYAAARQHGWVGHPDRAVRRDRDRRLPPAGNPAPAAAAQAPQAAPPAAAAAPAAAPQAAPAPAAEAPKAVPPDFSIVDRATGLDSVPMMAAWARSLDELDEELNLPDLPYTQLDKSRDKLEAVRREIDHFVEVLAPKLDAAKAQVDNLGAVPATGEPEAVAGQRAELAKAFGSLSAAKNIAEFDAAACQPDLGPGPGDPPPPIRQTPVRARSGCA